MSDQGQLLTLAFVCFGVIKARLQVSPHEPVCISSHNKFTLQGGINKGEGGSFCGPGSTTVSIVSQKRGAGRQCYLVRID